MESSALLIDLAVALSAGLVGALIATILRQSTIVGFIAAGVVIGPHTPGLRGDIIAVEELANIGLVLLMFTIGVHISLRELAQVGRVAMLGGSVQIVTVIGVGLGIGLLLGWGPLEATFFGAVLAISSGAVMSRLLGDRGELGAAHGRIALGWSALQDFATIVLVVVLSALATGENNLPLEVGRAAGEAAIFLALVLPLGSRVLPWLIKHVAALQNREVFVLSIAALALGTAYLASLFGLSLALGAFVAGVVVSESDLSHQVLGQTEPLRDIFGGLFFVSIGMFVDPAFVIANIPQLLITLFVIVVVKGLVITGLVALFKYPLRTGLLTGLALSQAGEFSFLLARLGGELEVVSETVFNLMLAGSAISMLLTAPLLLAVDPLMRALGLARAAMQEDAESRAASIKDHVVLCGYGRVGRVIGEELIRREIPFLVVEEDPNRIGDLQQQDIPIVLGYAELPAVLDQAGLERAEVLVIAIPDMMASQRIIHHALEVNPNLEIIVRAQEVSEQRAFVEQGATEALVGELELAIEMIRFTLQRYEVPSMDILTTLRDLRTEASADSRPRSLP